MAFPQTRELAPHDPPMLIVDELVEWAADKLTSRYTVSTDNLFYVPGRGMPAYVVFEIMAQSPSVKSNVPLSGHLGQALLAARRRLLARL